MLRRVPSPLRPAVAVRPRTASRRLATLLSATSFVGAAFAGAGCTERAPPPTSEPPPQAVSVVEASAPEAPPEGAGKPALPRKNEQLRGIGWYPNVEVTNDNQLVLAWVDADRGDVRLATTAPGGSTILDDVIVVDKEGAVGGFLRLALLPGDVPLVSYVREDKHLLRLAWRDKDRAAMKAAGADVDVAALPPLPSSSNAAVPLAVGDGFVAEEVGFGEQVGRGSSLLVDKTGRLGLLYYAADDRLRLARRPADVPAFGPASTGVLEKRDVDLARGSVRVNTDTLVLDDGTLVVSYADDVVTDARLRVAVLRPGAERFTVVPPDDDAPSIALDGLMSSLHARASAEGGRIVDVASLDKSERAVFVRGFDVDRVAFTGPREKLVDVNGTAVVERSPTGWLVLARVRGEGAGVYLYVVDEKRDEQRPERVVRETRRIRLGGGDQDDAWLDLVVRPDGRPAAVWYDAALAGLRLYAP
jgi:hypothetical protein